MEEKHFSFFQQLKDDHLMNLIHSVYLLRGNQSSKREASINLRLQLVALIRRTVIRHRD